MRRPLLLFVLILIALALQILRFRKVASASEKKIIPCSTER